jgi:hypothetical protein
VFVRLLPKKRARLNDDAGAAGLSIAGYLRAGRLGDEAAGLHERVMAVCPREVTF